MNTENGVETEKAITPESGVHGENDGMTAESGKYAEFYRYLPELTKQGDFDDFWEETLRDARSAPLHMNRKRVEYVSPYVEVYEVSYEGIDGSTVYGWYLLPAFVPKEQKLPCLIHYHGFSYHRGEPCEFMPWLMMGMAVLSVDCRDQGGKTVSKSPAPYFGNVACRGVLDKQDYYYRYVYTDSIRAIDCALAQPEVDGSKIVIEGGSQGGAIGMAVVALDDRPVLAMVDVPSNSNLEARVEGEHGAFASVSAYVKRHPEHAEKALNTLSYFDTMNLADRIECPVFASVGLLDDTCPPKMYFATYNRIRTEKRIIVYPMSGHEGGGSAHTEAKLAYLKEKLAGL